MKSLRFFSALMLSAVQIAQAEPVFMPQAVSIVKGQELEVGIDTSFGYQEYELASAAGTTFKDQVWTVPVWVRYGILDNLEGKLAIPFVSAVSKSEGASSSRRVSDGLGSIQLGTKWNFLTGKMPVAMGLDVDLPTNNSHRNRAALGPRYSQQAQQGLNGHLFLAADTPRWNELLSGHTMLGYMKTGKYQNTNHSWYDPSDLVTFGASLDMSMERWVKTLSFSAEMLGNTGLNKSETNGTDNGASQGTVIAVGPALRYDIGRVRTHAGVLFDVGKTEFRAYNTRVNFGASMLFGGK